MTAETMTEQRSLHRKLAEVMAVVERIPKNGTAPPQMGGFKFVQVGDAADAIRKALAERKVSMLPTAIELLSQSEHETARGGTMTTETYRTTWTLTDGESGETAVIQSVGTGADTGDKASPKAQTNAMKYALLMGFLLSTGEDPELSDSSDRGRQTQSRDAAGATTKPEEELRPISGDNPDGTMTRVGVIGKGDGVHSRLEARQTPDGYHVGFRLVLDADKAIPQVVAEGPIGAALVALGDPAKLVGTRVTVTGRLYAVHYPQRRTYHRLVLTAISSDEWTIPADPEPAEPPADEPTEAASVPLFDEAEQQAIADAVDAAPRSRSAA